MEQTEQYKRLREVTKAMGLREVADLTSGIPLRSGGLGIMIDKIVDEIEKLQGKKDDN